MRIGLISQWFPPEASFITGNLATGLAGRDHDVRVLTTFPSYPQGRTYPGYRQRWNDRTVHGGALVRRVPAYPSRDRSAVRRVASYLSFGASSAAAGVRYLARRDVNYVYLSPPTAAVGAVLTRALHRVPYVLHVQDPWPESVVHSGMVPGGRAGSVLGSAIASVVRRLYRSAAAIVVISPAMAEMVIAAGADPARVRVLLNWTDERLYRPVPRTAAARAELGHPGRCTVLYAGNIGPVQRLETAVRAAAAVPDRMDLVLMGSGVAEHAVRRLVDELAAPNVRILPRRPAAAMAGLYAAADYLLVCLRDAPGLRGTVPSKLQAALACGAPVIVSAGGDAAKLTRSAGVGFVCPPEDWRTLAEQFAAAADLPPQARAEMGERARRTYLERMSLRSGLDQFEDILAKVAGMGAP
ncbi:glycosyltransferase family 4 protein [Micromonospora zhanjiangensis]|uniref:Glycosyltransferase family 4 protein n=1 Tax=Micromonospora zhanjiangensis TaxID=1522057 RepID=A0ABV8KIL1_9ACTN